MQIFQLRNSDIIKRLKNISAESLGLKTTKMNKQKNIYNNENTTVLELKK